MLACSLYVPHLARYIAYAHCRLSLPSHDDVKKNGTIDCGCDNLNPVAPVPAAPVDDKQKEISRNGDWKYLETDQLTIGHTTLTNNIEYRTFNNPLIKDEWRKDIFHPPSVA